MSTFETLIEGLCSQTGMAKEQVLGQEPVNLVFDERIGVEISHDAANREVCLASRLFQVNDEDDLAAMALLIAQANFEKNQLYRAHLAMGEEGTIVLLRAVPMDALDETSFNKVMREFVDAAAHWSDAITSMSKLLKEHHSSASAEESPGVQIKV